MIATELLKLFAKIGMAIGITIIILSLFGHNPSPGTIYLSIGVMNVLLAFLILTMLYEKEEEEE